MNRPTRYRVDLPRYMSTCDANYIRLLKLLPDLESAGSDHGGLPAGSGQSGVVDALSLDSWQFRIQGIQTVHGELTVSVRLLEQFRYTQTLEIAAFPDIDRLIKAPIVLVRVYHDAATAEVVSYQRTGGFAPRYELHNREQYQQDEKQQVNQFLGEWLNLCISSGVSRDLPAAACPA